ncbi:MAG: hypothetical protein R2845_05665 [Thermomicrobiales bacterium]
MARASELQYADGIGGAELEPIVSLTGSDSLSLDNTLELLPLRPLVDARPHDAGS